MSISSYDEWRHAKVGLFLSDENNDIFALTCKHVTQFPDDGKFYVETNSGKMEILGTVLNKSPESLGPTDRKFYYDVDVIKICGQFENSCRNWDPIILSKYNSVSMFNGPRDALFNSNFASLIEGNVSFHNDSKKLERKNENEYTNPLLTITEVVKDRDLNVIANPIKKTSENNGSVEEKSKHILETESVDSHEQILFTSHGNVISEEAKTKVNAYDTCISGRIESRKVHEAERTDLPEYNILLRPYGKDFEPGDSGIVIASENGGGLELVGVLTGAFKSEINNENYITCLLLQKSIEILREVYNKQFVILDTSRLANSKDAWILSGFVIWIKTTDLCVKSPEDIAEVDYNFVEIILNLIDNMKDDDIPPEKLQLEVTNEKLLSKCVSSMKQLKFHEYLCDSPAVACYYSCMRGCSF